MTPPPLGRDRRPADERGPVSWGGRQQRPDHAAGPSEAVPRRRTFDPLESRSARGGAGQNEESLPSDGTHQSEGGAPTVDWGVDRESPEPGPTPGQRARSPWPTALRRQRVAGVLYALLGLVLATWSAMNLATAADAGHPWLPPWLVVVLGGAGLVSAAGYLAWAGGTPVGRESERWAPSAVDDAAGLTRPSARGVAAGPVHVMGTSTVDPSRQAPAGVAGAVGGFMLAGAVVCAVIALVLGPAWLLGTAALALGGTLAIRLAGDWLGHV